MNEIFGHKSLTESDEEGHRGESVDGQISQIKLERPLKSTLRFSQACLRINFINISCGYLAAIAK